MSNENLRFDRNTFTNKGVALDFAPSTNFSAFLYFNKFTDSTVFTNLTPIQVHKGINADTGS